MTAKTSISLTDEQESYARSLVERGQFSNLSAVLQHGLEMLRDAEMQALRPIEIVSNSLFEAVKKYNQANINWDDDIYGRGPFPRPIEVRVTRCAVHALGGVAEVSQNNVPPLLDQDQGSLNAAFQAIRNVIGVNARIDGFIRIRNLDCFVEVKISKIDRVHGGRGGQCLYDIGQWAHDIGRLAIIGQHFPNASLIYGIVAIRGSAASELNRADWLNAFRKKLITELCNDLRRISSELNENTPHRIMQAKILEKLCSLSDTDFFIKASDKWAIITIEARPFVGCLPRPSV
jgi:Arc/MetJ-type ribon-helix-helix transcriptional regulator